MAVNAIDQIINEELGSYQDHLINKLSQEIRKKRLVLTQDLLKSLQAEVIKAADTRIAQLHLAFEQHGRIKDMRAVRQSKMPPIEAIEKFVEKKGVDKFQYVPGYPRRNYPTQQEAIKRIAWGIALSRKGKDIPQKTGWFNKPFYSSLNLLIVNITDRYMAAAGKEVIAPLKDLKK